MMHNMKHWWTTWALALGSVSCSGALQERPDHASPPIIERADDEAHELIKAFHQDNFGNCTSIGFIKAVLYAYHGYDGAFLSVTASADGTIAVVTKSKTKFTVTPQELALAGQGAGLVYQDKVKKQKWAHKVELLYAVLAKSCAADCIGEQKYCVPDERRSCSSFETALGYLDNGLKWSAPPRLLGLDEGVDWRVLRGWRGKRWLRIAGFVSGGRSCVAATPWHTFFVSGGVFDLYGDIQPFSKTDSRKALFANHAYCLRELEGNAAIYDDADQRDASYDKPAVMNPPFIDVEGETTND